MEYLVFDIKLQTLNCIFNTKKNNAKNTLNLFKSTNIIIFATH